MPAPPARILLIRTSSLGDVVHMLPAVSDIARHYPDARIDWLVEEAFAEIPGWHPAVAEVIPVAQRRWRKTWWSGQVRAERAALVARLRRVSYDVVLDAQGLLKSAWLARQARGVKHGLDWRSARESLASLVYDVRHRVDFEQAAVTRQRLLASQALGYAFSDAPAFGLQTFAAQGQTRGRECYSATSPDAAKPYAVIMPSASRDDKLWPQDDWRAVLAALVEAGLQLRLLAGNAAGDARARALLGGGANLDAHAEVMPRMSLTDVAHLLAGARLMVGLDSGLTHLSAALGRPTVAIYRASSPVRTPLVGAGGTTYTASLGARGAPPDRATVLRAVDEALSSEADPAALASR